MTYARIAGTGSYLPERVVTNKDLEATLDTTDEWIAERTGIRQRHIADDDETSASMGLAAARNALEMAGLDASEVDMIVVGTTTPDKKFPSNACIIQRQLDIHGGPAFDVQAVCSGFVYALDVANRMIVTGGAKTALVIGTETLTRITNWEDRTTAVLFGDGAGAVVLQASDEPGILSTHIHADGEFENLLEVPMGEEHIAMNGNAVFRKAVATLGAIARETLAANDVQKSDLDWLVPHQANLRIISAAAKKLDLPMEQVVVTVDKHANTSAASIPLALDAAVRDGRIQRGQMLLLEAFGGGFTWGSALLKY